MSGKKIKFNDDLFRNLLMNYKKEEPDVSMDNKINNLVDNYYLNKEKERINIFSPVPAIAFAGLLLAAIVFIVFQFAIPVNLNQKLLITKYNKKMEHYEYVTKNTILKTGVKEETKIQTGQALFFLKENSLFRVKRDLNKIDYYYFDYGDIYVDADNLKKGDRLEFITKIGKIEVVGTKFEIESNDDIFRIKCFEGMIEFSGKDIKGNKLFVSAGSELTFKNSEFKILPISNMDMVNVKRDMSGKLEDEIITLNIFDLNIDNSDATIFINGKYSGNGDARYMFNEKDNISITVKLDGYEDINKDINLEYSTKLSLNMKKIELNKNVSNNQLVINWKIKLDDIKYSEVIIFKDHVGLISSSNIAFFNKKDGTSLKKIQREKNQEGFAVYRNNLAFYESPGKVKIIGLPQFKEIFESKVGPVAFGRPAISDQYLVVASTDHNIYVYDYLKKKLINKYNSEAGFYCTPLIVKNKIILSDLAKSVMVYSIEGNNIIWEKKNSFRFVFEAPIISANNEYFALKDEESKLHIYKFDDGTLKNSYTADKNKPSSFIGNDLLIYNDDTLRLYDINQTQSTIKLKEHITGFFAFDDIIYLLYPDRLEALSKALMITHEIGIAKINLYGYKDGGLYILTSENELLNITLINQEYKN